MRPAAAGLLWLMPLMVLLLFIGGCTAPLSVPTSASDAGAASTTSSPASQTATPQGAATTASKNAPAMALLPLQPPVAARNWDDFQLQAARRLVAANPGRTYLGAVPDPLLAIPVLEVELTADGQVSRIKVLRTPTQATDTVQLAIDAVHRAAPYGQMQQLGKPWRFVEVFLFDDERRFKPRTLDN
jgi:hypothetical protein